MLDASSGAGGAAGKNDYAKNNNAVSTGDAARNAIVTAGTAGTAGPTCSACAAFARNPFVVDSTVGNNT